MDELDELIWSFFVVRDVSALVNGRQESGRPQLRANNREARAHDDEAGQVLILGAEAISHPGAHGRTTRELIARIHEQKRWLVIRPVRVHGPDGAATIDAA